jgi:NitT/TauT family transport system permease protein
VRQFFRYNAIAQSWRFTPNRWDGIAVLLVFTCLVLLGSAARQMSVPYHLGEPIAISLSLSKLPGYALQTVLRMFIALFISLLFTFTVGTLAAKNRHAQKVIIPIIDILQSIPVMGFLTITVVGFIELFPGNLLGVQCAAIFAIFTSQVWNMVLSFYQSLITLPAELKEAADMFHLSPWQRFWRVEVPFAMPGLLWNTMLSMSASWFFVVASEAVTVSNQTITLPGIGSYIALAIAQKDMQGIIYTILCMFCVILIYDQLLFRPLIQWSDRFRIEQPLSQQTKNSWVAQLFRRTVLFQYVGKFLAVLSDKWVNFRLFNIKHLKRSTLSHQNFNFSPPSWINQKNINTVCVIVYYILLTAIIVFGVIKLEKFIVHSITFSEIKHVLFLGLCTLLRVISIVMVSTLIWLPLGVWIGLRPRLAEIVQPIVQFLAAFPANLLFPLFVIFIVRYHLNVDIWTTPLMFLGTQWYILFNVIAGASALPKDLRQATDNFGVKGLLWWRRLILPGVFPYYITGAITAAGNAWNTSTLAEIVSWGNTTLQAHGLGAYIMTYSAQGNFPFLVIGICVMSLFVLTLNHLVWRPLYKLAHNRYQLES